MVRRIIAKGIRLVALSSVLTAIGFSSPELNVKILSNGVGAFVLENSDAARAFIEANRESEIEFEFYDPVTQSHLLRYVDKGTTLAAENGFLEVLTMSPLNVGAVFPGAGRYLDGKLIVSTKSVEELFTDSSLYGTSLERRRVAVVVATADAYLTDPDDRMVTKAASEVPLRFFGGENLARDDKGRLPLAMRVKEILHGYPQSYDFDEALRQHAKAVGKVRPKAFRKNLSESVGGPGLLKVSIVERDGSAAVKAIRLSAMRENAVPIIPPRLIPTGNIYRDPELEPFNYFRLPGHSIAGFDLNTVGRSLFPGQSFFVEVVAYNDYSLTVPSTAGSFFLLLPPEGATTDYFLACFPPVGVDGKSRLQWSDVVFGVVEVNLVAF